MEYFIGSVSTLIVVYFISKYYRTEKSKVKPIVIKSSQVKAYELIKPIVPLIRMVEKEFKNVTTQSTIHYDNTHIKVLMANNSAYWIKDNVFYTADIVDGEIVESSTRQVDTMTMNDVQLKEISEIVDILREGRHDDYRSSGN